MNRKAALVAECEIGRSVPGRRGYLRRRQSLLCDCAAQQERANQNRAHQLKYSNPAIPSKAGWFYKLASGFDPVKGQQ
jgi:hypothetical protein